MSYLRHLMPGEQLAGLPAEAHNAFFDTYKRVMQQGGPANGTGQSSSVRVLNCLVRNDSGAAIVADFPILQLEDVLVDYDDNNQVIYRGAGFSGTTPASDTDIGRIAVVQGPIADDVVRSAVLLGPTWCQVYVSDAAHTFAKPQASNTELASDAAAGAPIIWKQSGTGTKWAIILLGGGGGGSTIEYPPKLVLIDQDVTGVYDAVPEVQQTAADFTAATIHSGEAQTGSTASTIKLAAAASETNDAYTGATVTTTGGTGSGQTREITGYVGSTRVATVTPNWTTTPDATTDYDIKYTVVLQDPADDDYDLNQVAYLNTTNYRRKLVTLKYFEADPIEHTGTAVAGASTTIELEHTASTINDFYVGSTIETTGGTGSGQTKTITDYDAATFTATVDSAWSTNPASGTTYEITSDVYSKLATTSVVDETGKRLVVRFATVDVYFDDDLEVGEYGRENYPGYPEDEAFPPDGTGTYAEPAAGFLAKRYRGLAVGNVVATAFCTLLPPPNLIEA